MVDMEIEFRVILMLIVDIIPMTLVEDVVVPMAPQMVVTLMIPMEVA